MEIKILEAAEAELDEVFEYYNSQLPGLGEEFLLEFLKGTDRIKNYPDAWHPFSSETRRCRLDRFPYAIIYLRESERIMIIAVASLHRKPFYWKDRI